MRLHSDPDAPNVREMSDVDARDYDLDDELDVGEPRRLKALGDPLRMRITTLVLERAMSVTELAERLGRPKGTVAYHVDLLHDAGVLKVVRTRRVRTVQERYYGRVARSYVFPATPGEVPFLREFASRIDHERWSERHDDHSAGFATLRYTRLSAARATEYRHRLLALALEFADEPREGDTEYGMYLALFPTVAGADPAT